jgi:hypothetical protein
MGLHADGDAEPAGERHVRLEHPGRGPELPLAFRVFGRQRTAEDPHQRCLPVAREFEEPAELRARAVAGEPDGGVHRHDRQASQGPLDPGAIRSRHGRIDELAVDQPELEAGITPAAAERDGGGQRGVGERQRAEGDTW